MNCTECGQQGRSVSALTVVSNSSATEESAEWFICRSFGCDVVYFSINRAITLDAVDSTPFVKSDDPDRLVCFCFQHSASSILADPSIRERIREKCGAGEDDCERKNPQGRCCLGDIGRLLKSVEDEGCC